jgi:hypothetical protein
LIFLLTKGIIQIMPTRSSKKPRLPDPNVLAFNIVKAMTSEPSGQSAFDPASPQTVTGVDEKNAAAVTLGRLGGMKGGLARAKKLTKKERSDIARKAALARWSKKHGKKKETARKIAAGKNTAASL